MKVMFSELNEEITVSEIENAIRQLKLVRSGGTDLFINEFLYYGKDALWNTLFAMFNNIFKLGYFPELWSEEFMIPLHKKVT